jgi:arylsulfatase A-like enzyme
VLAAGVALVVLGERLGRGPEPPSFVLITVDSLRADRLGVYGHSRTTSPRIDALAARGIVFERAFTVETLSAPSHASILTSLYPATHGVAYNGYRLPEEAETLAEILGRAGYRTAAFVSDILLDARFGFDQGFDKFERSQVPSRPGRGRQLNAEGRSYQLARYWLRAARDDRFFLWLHCHQPHFSYDPLPPWDHAFDADIPRDWPLRDHHAVRVARAEGRLTARDVERVGALYDGEVALTDHLLGPLFDELASHARPVVVLLTADHGELLFDGGTRRLDHGRGDFYDGALRVPLIVVPPAGEAFRPGRVSTLVSTVDLLPTVLDLAGLDAPSGLEGRSLVGLLSGRGEGRDRVYATYVREADRPTLAVRDARFKLIDRGGNPPRSELYDLTADPHERHDLAAERAEVASRRAAELRAWYAGRPRRLAGAEEGLSREVRALLRQGGYLEADEASDDVDD